MLFGVTSGSPRVRSVTGHMATVYHDSLPLDVTEVTVHENREQIPSTLAHQRPDNYRENDW